MKLTYRTKSNRAAIRHFIPKSYIGIDLKSHTLTVEDAEHLENIKHVGECDFKGDMFIGYWRDFELYTTEIVVFFGTFEEKDV